MGEGTGTPGGQWDPFGELQDNTPWACSAAFLQGMPASESKTGRGEGSFVETQHPLSLVVLFMSTDGALPRSPPTHE